MSAVNRASHHRVKLPRQRLRHLASKILEYHEFKARKQCGGETHQSPLTVVCISDTHNHQPTLPSGDILLHAGDLTENGSFNEVQAQLDYINRQQHRYKVVIAGNHDVLLDEAFLRQHPERRYGDTRTKADLKWGDIVYLEHGSTELRFPSRTLTVFGSPLTPRYGISAFQHAPGEDHWAGCLSKGTDIVISHGPPRLHLDNRPHAGCPYLAQEVGRSAPRLVVFGHIHAGYGLERVRYDRVRTVFESVEIGWAGWLGLIEMIFWTWVHLLLQWVRWDTGTKETIMVNASMVGGRDDALKNEPTVVSI